MFWGRGLCQPGLMRIFNDKEVVTTNASDIGAMLIILGMTLVFHLLVLVQWVSFDYVCGGRLQTVEQMRFSESLSIVITITMITVIAIKGAYIRSSISSKIINGFLWLFMCLFIVGTIGNFFAKTIVETVVFTPLSLISALLCFRIASSR